MRHDRDPYRDHQYVPDTFWLVVAALLFAACGLVWLIGQVAAILFGPHHQHLPVRLVDMLGVLLRLPGTWDDPAQAWPPSSQPLLPGPVGMYAAAILTFWLPALAYGLLVRLLSPRARRRRCRARRGPRRCQPSAAPARTRACGTGARSPRPARDHQGRGPGLPARRRRGADLHPRRAGGGARAAGQHRAAATRRTG